MNQQNTIDIDTELDFRVCEILKLTIN